MLNETKIFKQVYFHVSPNLILTNFHACCGSDRLDNARTHFVS